MKRDVGQALVAQGLLVSFALVGDRVRLLMQHEYNIHEVIGLQVWHATADGGRGREARLGGVALGARDFFLKLPMSGVRLIIVL